MVSGTPGTIAVTTALTGQAEGLSLANAGWPVFHPSSIASGAPDGFRLTITKIVADDVDVTAIKSALTQAHVDQFATQGVTGQPLEALKAMVGKPYDNLDLLIDAVQKTGVTQGEFEAWAGDKSAGSFEVPTDPSKTNRVVLFEKKEGVTIEISSGTVDLSQLLAAAGGEGTQAAFKVPVGTYRRISIDYKVAAEIKGCVSGDFETNGGGVAGTQGAHTYCTRSGYSTFDSTAAQPADFENRSETEWVKLSLNVDSTGAADDVLAAQYPLSTALEVKKDDKVELSMVLDLNRMLRFFNRGRLDQGPTPQSPKDRAYFFTTVFDQSVYVFLGKPGRIYGYEMLADACPAASFSGGACSESSTPVAFWLTIITSPEGKPLISSFMPDDDNTLTVVKGTTFGTDAPYTAGSAAGKVDIHYSLDQAELGHLHDFPADLEAAAVGDDVSGVSFEALQDGSNEYKGNVFAIRRL